MQDFTSRLSRLSAELAALEDELRRRAPGEGVHPVQLCDQELLAEIKNAVDGVRHLLWPYVEASAKEGVDQALQLYRMQRVTEMLHDLKDRVAEPALASMPEAKSFFASIHEIATATVERHLERVVPAPRKRPTSEGMTLDRKRMFN